MGFLVFHLDDIIRLLPLEKIYYEHFLRNNEWSELVASTRKIILEPTPVIT